MVELLRIKLSKAVRINLDTEWREDYRRSLQGICYAFILVKLGGDLETSTVKIMAKVTSEMKVPFIIFAHMPSAKIAGEQEIKNASNALDSLRPLSNAIVVVPDDSLFKTMPEDIPVAKAYERATEWFAEAVASVAKPFALKNVTGMNASNIDWLVKKENSTCSIGIGWGDGPNAAEEALDQLVQSPFLKRNAWDSNVDAALVILSVAPEVTKKQADQIQKQIKGIFYENIKLSICICVDDSLAEGIRITALLRSTDSLKPEEQEFIPKIGPEPTKKRNNNKKTNPNQMTFPFFVEQNLGIFSAKEPTKYGVDNLDLPTYSRRNLYINLD